jgi:sporulation integral membrane protein YlbJ
MQLSSRTRITQAKPNKILMKVCIVLFLALILIFPTSSYYGAKKGLLLWFNTILPTLLPFIILSNLIIRLQITKPLSKLLYPIFHLLFHASKGGCYPILIGFLSGIPVGAKSTADLVRNETLTCQEGQFLLGFCNNASPMFIMSFIAISQLNHSSLRISLLFIMYFSAILASVLYFRFLAREKNIRKQSLTSTQYDSFHTDLRSIENDRTEAVTKFDFALIDSAIMDGFEVITKVGGYIILFSIPAEIISNIGSTDSLIKLLCIGFIEITTGINHIGNSNLDMNTKIALITMITAFGGLSGLAQTKSVISNTRLSIGTYFKVKLLHMAIAFILAALYVMLIF